MKLIALILLALSLQSKQLPYDSVDCDNAHGDPRRCTVEPDEQTWVAAPSTDVVRHITETVGKRYHQHCTNGGLGDEPGHDGFRRCVDTFTNKKTGAKCKINPDYQNGFVCLSQK